MLFFRHAGKTSSIPPPAGGLSVAIVAVVLWRKEYHVLAAVKGHCRRFDPGGSLDRRVNYRRVPQPRWVGAGRSTKGETGVKGKPAAFVLSCAQVGCACSRGLHASAWEGARGLHASSRPLRAANLSYECPGPSFYRRKERAQVYNGRCSSVLTCLAERS